VDLKDDISKKKLQLKEVTDITIGDMWLGDLTSLDKCL
jgi:hypothetical protein